MLLCICGPSGIGKSYLCALLIKYHSNLTDSTSNNPTIIYCYASKPPEINDTNVKRYKLHKGLISVEALLEYKKKYREEELILGESIL